MKWGVVFGGAGVLGAAWMAGALAAWADRTGRDPRQADLLVGGSAGAMSAALLGSGVSLSELIEHELGRTVRSGPLARVTAGAVPDAGHFGSGAWALVEQRPGVVRKVPPSPALAGILPPGRGDLASVGRLVDDVQAAHGRGPGQWSVHPGVRVTATDYTSGARVCFGEPGAPAAGLAEAVMASCAVPGWYPTVTIGGRNYVDGGAASGVDLDLVIGQDLDEVLVLAPMMSLLHPAPPTHSPHEQALRRRVTARALLQAEQVRDAGTQVTLVCPGAGEITAFGADQLDPTRRHLVLDDAFRCVGKLLSDPQALRREQDRAQARLAAQTEAAEHRGHILGGEQLPHSRPAAPKSGAPAATVKQSDRTPRGLLEPNRRITIGRERE